MIRALTVPAAAVVFVTAWVVELARLAVPDLLPVPIGAVLMGAFVVLAALRLRRATRILCLILISLAILMLALFGGWDGLIPALDRTAVFAAFFGTILILRGTADRRKEITASRKLFDAMSIKELSSAFLLGSHLVGALLVVGVLAVLAPIQSPDASDEDRRLAAESSLRGMCIAPLWSPFWIAMAVSYQHLPDVPLWHILAIGLVLSALGLVLAHVMYNRDLSVRRALAAMAAFVPVIPPVVISATVIVLLTSLTPLSTLQSVAVGTPILCGLALAPQGFRILGGLARDVGSGIERISDEVSLITIALVLGRVLQHAMAEAGATTWIDGLDLLPVALIAATVVAMTLAAVMGIHQFVSITVMLALLAPLTGDGPGMLSATVLMEAALIGWAFASMIGISAVSVAVGGTMFRVPMERLAFGPNLRYVAIFGVLCIVLLALLNRIMIGG